VATGVSTADHFVGVETSSNVVCWMWNEQEAATATNQRRVRSAKINNAGTVTVSAGTAIYNQHLLTRPWVHDGIMFAVAYYAGASVGAATTPQPTYFIWTFTNPAVSLNAGAVGKIMSFRGVDEATLTSGSLNLRPSGVSEVSDGVYWLGGCGAFGGLMCPARLEIDFTKKPQSAVAGASLVLSGSMPMEYDGSYVVEQNFSLFPEITTTTNTGTGGSLSDGTYQVALVFVSVDANGNVHRSAPSAPVSVTLSGGTGAQRITVFFANPSPTRRPIRVESYLTEAGGTTFYLSGTSGSSSTVATSVEGSVGANSVSTSSRILYTNGGILDNSSPPSFVSIASKSNRVYGVTHDGVVWHTKEIIEGEGPAYVQDISVVRLPSDGSETFGLVVQDDILIVLGEQSLFAMSGEGINDTGTSNTLSPPRSVPFDGGAAGGGPLLATEAGIWFRGARGLRLLTRSLAVDPVAGAEVDGYSSLTPVSAVLVPKKNQIRFGHSDGETLVYDYLAGKWSVETGHTQVSAVMWRGEYAMVASDGVVVVQSAGSSDDGASIDLVVETPWVKLANVQGFQRIYYASLLGAWKSAHTLTLKIYYDYNDTVAETVTKDLSTGYSVGDPLQVRHHLGRKCEAVKFRIEDSDQSGSKESFSLTGISLEIGGKKGVFKLPAGKTA
jgi:hypothetical protein